MSFIFKKLASWYEAYQERKIEKHYKTKKTVVDGINKKIALEGNKDAPSDEVLKDLHRKLNNIISVK